MACKGVCIKIRVAKVPLEGGRYLAGQKRCNTCEEYVICDKIRCPCCGMLFRTHPRAKKYKSQLKSRKAAQT